MSDPTSPSDYAALLEEVRQLRLAFADQKQQDTIQKDAFNRLYSELEQYKEDFIFQSEKPLLLDLLLFYDSMSWFHESIVKQEMAPDAIEESFQYLMDELLELLYRRDVTPMEPAERFHKERHRARQIVKTHLPEHHERITQVLKRGFLRSEKVLRAEDVIVARHETGSSET